MLRAIRYVFARAIADRRCGAYSSRTRADVSRPEQSVYQGRESSSVEKFVAMLILANTDFARSYAGQCAQPSQYMLRGRAKGMFSSDFHVNFADRTLQFLELYNKVTAEKDAIVPQSVTN